MKFKSDLGELNAFRQSADDFIGDELDELEKNRVILALDEAFVNVVEHGYRGKPDGEIDLSMRRIKGGLEFSILDRAEEFDPTTKGQVDLIEHGAGGASHGLGIHLYTTIMKTRYEARPGGGNCLILLKEAGN